MSTRNMIKRADIMRVTDLEGFTLSELAGQRADCAANKANENAKKKKKPKASGEFSENFNYFPRQLNKSATLG